MEINPRISISWLAGAFWFNLHFPYFSSYQKSSQEFFAKHFRFEALDFSSDSWIQVSFVTTTFLLIFILSKFISCKVLKIDWSEFLALFLVLVWFKYGLDKMMLMQFDGFPISNGVSHDADLPKMNFWLWMENHPLIQFCTGLLELVLGMFLLFPKLRYVGLRLSLMALVTILFLNLFFQIGVAFFGFYLCLGNLVLIKCHSESFAKISYRETLTRLLFGVSLIVLITWKNFDILDLKMIETSWISDQSSQNPLTFQIHSDGFLSVNAESKTEVFALLKQNPDGLWLVKENDEVFFVSIIKLLDNRCNILWKGEWLSMREQI